MSQGFNYQGCPSQVYNVQRHQLHIHLALVLLHRTFPVLPHSLTLLMRPLEARRVPERVCVPGWRGGRGGVRGVDGGQQPRPRGLLRPPLLPRLRRVPRIHRTRPPLFPFSQLKRRSTSSSPASS